MWALTLIGLAGCPHPARTAPDAPLPDRPADHVYQDTPDSGLLFVWKVGDGYEVASVARGTATSVELDATSAEQVVTVDLRDGRRLPAVRDTSPWTQSVARWMGKALDAPVSVTGTPSEPDPVPPEVVSVPGAEQSTLDKGRINETITGALQQVRDCYRAVLHDEVRLGGYVSIQFVIGPDGAVRWSRVGSDTLHHEQVTDCILDVIDGLVFDAPHGGGVVIVTYPFVFAPGGAAAAE
jgi:hypothetical protein